MEAMKLKASIPVPLDIRFLAEVLKSGDPGVEVFLVGGCVRDYLMWKYHTDQSKEYVAKDYDLTTNLTEEEILRRLSTPEAKRFLIRVKEKESVDTFGVVFVSVDGRGPYEVAPFRRDVGSVDGRRPERVEVAPIHEDAQRRDFTINNLYYDFYKGEILDFNENGQGVEDVKARVVRPVGDPFDRFEEDKLRILRMVRFFSRYNEGLIVDWLDQRTRDAVEKYKDLRSFKGMSPERIQTEFMMGLAQCKNTGTYLKNYRDLDLFGAVFPGVGWWVPSLERLGNCRNPKVVLAMLLFPNRNVGAYLNTQKYPNEIADPVQFLVDAMKFDPRDAVDVLKARDRRLVKSTKRELTYEEKATNDAIQKEVFQDIMDLASVTDDPYRVALLEHLAGFSATVTSGEELMKQGLKGKEIGDQQRKELQTVYFGSLDWFLKTRKPPFGSVQ